MTHLKERDNDDRSAQVYCNQFFWFFDALIWFIFADFFFATPLCEQFKVSSSEGAPPPILNCITELERRARDAGKALFIFEFVRVVVDI